MKSMICLFSLFALAGCAGSTGRSGGVAFEQGYPTAEAARAAQDDADFQRAVTAYRFWYPTVSCHGMVEGGRAAGVQDNTSFMVMACTPKQVAFTPNSDTPYGAGAINLSEGPWVVEIPPGTFIGLVDDHHQGWGARFELKGAKGASVDLYFGPAAPVGHEERWIKTIPGKGLVLLLPHLWAGAAAFDGSWRPGDFEEAS